MLLKQNSFRSSFRKRNKGIFKTYYCLLKVRREAQFFLGFYFPFFFVIAFLVVVKTLQKKNQVIKICISPALLEGCASCVQFHLPIWLFQCLRVVFRGARHLLQAPWSQHCCAAAVRNQSVLVPSSCQTWSSAGAWRACPASQGGTQMQDSHRAQTCMHTPQLLLKPLTLA